MNATKYFLCAILVTFSITISQGQPTNDTAAYVIAQLYAHSFMFTNYRELSQVLTDDAYYEIPRANKVLIQKKDEILANVKSNEGMIIDCSDQVTVLSVCNCLYLFKVTFRFPNGYQDHFVTVEKVNKKWKVSQVVKMFVDKV